MSNHPLSALGAEPIAQFGVARQPIDGVGQPRGECGGVCRLKGAWLEMSVDEKAGFAGTDDLWDAADSRGDHRGLASHCLEIDDAKRLINRRAAEHRSVGVKLDDIWPRDHVAHPND